ncbi:GNAT family N-acetyltransferase [Cupriavidus respiraculi]|uniref:N-acetyltransferase domain-containing protein n=1 Tax=Cupriavidus respiraculi TaxID=195930 RepID=A0ABN7Z0N3_9BURK|nr:GNAT family N-acetyltransferase [Cupriavidus respiraculi]MBY4948566.1 GNAT family N-acetyltransferase [Cupriavidus respiraculi]CAG9179480.1 hypothetical protein LMG21510_03789 [Cupriavidus respiraculi]
MRPHPATRDDLEEIKALLRDCALDIADADCRIEQFLVVRDISGIIGCACVEQHGTTGVLKAIAVAERARSAGLGELLVGSLVADIRQRGVQTLVLRTDSATGFFSRLGFTPIPAEEIPPPLQPHLDIPADEPTAGTVMQAWL